MTALIESHDIAKRFGKVPALDGLDLTIRTGEITAILGPNGAGKTTFIRAIATLVRPDRGHLLVDGHDVQREPATVRRMIGLAGQTAAVEETMTGRENLVMVGRLYGLDRKTARSSAVETLAGLSLGDAADRPVRTYSGGMRRRLDVAASLVGSPRLLLLDEPTTGLDPRSRIELWDIVRSLGANGTDIVLTTQYLEEADQLASRIVIIDAGRVIADGTPGELKSLAGADRIELHTRDVEDLRRATEALARLSTEAPVVDSALRRCSITASGGSHLLRDAVRVLDDADVAIEDITLRRPTLDEVFLALTDSKEAA